MRVVIASDLHLHNWREFSKTDPETGLNTRLLDGIGVLRHIRDYLLGNCINEFWFLGDLFERGHLMSPDLLEAVVNELREFKKIKDLNVRFLVGNHDQMAIGGLKNALRPLSDYIEVIDYPQIRQLDDHFYVSFCPSRRDMEEQYDAINSLFKRKSGKSDYIFLGHFYLDKLLEEDGIPSQLMECVEWEKTARVFKNYKYMFLGDYHNPVITEYKGQKIESIGAVMHHSWKDTDRPQGQFLDIDFSTGERYYMMTEAPMFIDVDKEDSIQNKKDFYRMTVKNKEEAEDVIHKFGKEYNIKLKYLSEKAEVNNRIDVSHTNDPRISIEEFVIHSIDDAAQQKLLVKLGHAIYDEINL